MSFVWELRINRFYSKNISIFHSGTSASRRANLSVYRQQRTRSDFEKFCAQSIYICFANASRWNGPNEILFVISFVRRLNKRRTSQEIYRRNSGMHCRKVWLYEMYIHIRNVCLKIFDIHQHKSIWHQQINHNKRFSHYYYHDGCHFFSFVPAKFISNVLPKHHYFNFHSHF